MIHVDLYINCVLMFECKFYTEHPYVSRMFSFFFHTYKKLSFRSRLLFRLPCLFVCYSEGLGSVAWPRRRLWSCSCDTRCRSAVSSIFSMNYRNPHPRTPLVSLTLIPSAAESYLTKPIPALSPTMKWWVFYSFRLLIYSISTYLSIDLNFQDIYLDNIP